MNLVLLLSLGALSPAVNVHFDGLGPGFFVSGLAHVGTSGDKIASFAASCGMPPRLRLYVEVREHDVRNVLDDHESVDSRAASADARARVTWSTTSTRVGAEMLVHGQPMAGPPPTVVPLRDAEPLYSFVSTSAAANDELLPLFEAVSSEPGTLTWTLPATTNGSAPLVARFELDARAAASLHEAASSCTTAAAFAAGATRDR